jgi:hypothetical protein
VAFIKVLISNISYLNLPPPSLSFIPPYPHSWNSFKRSHFSIYIHVHSICILFTLLHPFPTSSPLPLLSIPPPILDLFCPPALWFSKRKKWHFCLFKIAIQGIPLWHFIIAWIGSSPLNYFYFQSWGSVWINLWLSDIGNLSLRLFPS